MLASDFHEHKARMEVPDSEWMPEEPQTEQTPDRALPTWAIDLLLFGVPKLTPAPKIWGKAVGIAMSAQARGWTHMEFVNEFMSRTKRKNEAGQKRYVNHRLWEQIQAYSKHGNGGLDELDKAWKQATVNLLSGEGLTTPEDLLNDAIERAWVWEDRINAGTDGLPLTEALVMSYVITYIEKRQMARVTCPCRDVGEFAMVPAATAARILRRLTDKGFLLQFSRGTWSKSPSTRKAAIYSLGDPYNLRFGGRATAPAQSGQRGET